MANPLMWRRTPRLDPISPLIQELLGKIPSPNLTRRGPALGGQIPITGLPYDDQPGARDRRLREAYDAEHGEPELIPTAPSRQDLEKLREYLMLQHSGLWNPPHPSDPDERNPYAPGYGRGLLDEVLRGREQQPSGSISGDARDRRIEAAKRRAERENDEYFDLRDAEHDSIQEMMGKRASGQPTHVLVKDDRVASLYINHPGPARGPRGDGWTEVEYDPVKHGRFDR